MSKDRLVSRILCSRGENGTNWLCRLAKSVKTFVVSVFPRRIWMASFVWVTSISTRI
jgi:hypothetical protein